MSGALGEMLFPKTSLADSLRALRAISVSTDMSAKGKGHPTMILSLLNSRQFDPTPFAVPLVLPPSSLFSKMGEPFIPGRLSDGNV